MPKLNQTPISEKDLNDYLESDSDFAFEMKVLSLLRKLNCACSHVRLLAWCSLLTILTNAFCLAQGYRLIALPQLERRRGFELHERAKRNVEVRRVLDVKEKLFSLVVNYEAPASWSIESRYLSFHKSPIHV